MVIFANPLNLEGSSFDHDVLSLILKAISKSRENQIRNRTLLTFEIRFYLNVALPLLSLGIYTNNDKGFIWTYIFVLTQMTFKLKSFGFPSYLVRLSPNSV